MILTSDEILKNIKSGHVVLEPFTIEQLNPNSYDLRLSNKLLVQTRNEFVMQGQQDFVLNDCHCKPISQYFYYIDSMKPNATVEIIIPEDGYILVPGVLYLGCTVEYTETHDFVPTIEGKSSIGRLGIDIHKTAGFGDLGFCGQWTLEITVVQPVKIYPNMKIAQIIYNSVLGDVTKTYQGKYQNQKGVMASEAYKDFK
jgi:dCTP deaminase